MAQVSDRSVDVVRRVSPSLVFLAFAFVGPSFLIVFFLAACKPAQPAQPRPQQGPYYGPNAPPTPNGQPPPPTPYPPSAPQAPARRPLLPPLVGIPAQQQEVRNVLAELINALSTQNQALVRGIPLQFDPTTEVNAYAGCDDNGQPFLAGTGGIL